MNETEARAGEVREVACRTTCRSCQSAELTEVISLGEQYVSLDPGGDTNYLKNGDRVAKTQSAVVLEKLLSQFMFSKAAEGGDKK